MTGRLLMRKFLQVFNILSLIFVSVVITGCDFNLLGGKNSEIAENYEPGKREESQAPPVISGIPDFTMDENDVQSVTFQISDIDSFLMCSSVFIKAKSSNTALIDRADMVVGGAYPNCTIRLSPKLYQFGSSTITVELYDFWTIVSTTFTLNVVHVLSPGPFAIIDAEGMDRSVALTWNTPTYMTGTSARYTVYYRETGSASGWSEITPAASPYTVTGLVNGTEYDFFIRARNSIGNRDTNIVTAIPTKYKLRGVEFVAGTNQFETGGVTNQFVVNSFLASHMDRADANYPESAPGSGISNYSTPENPINTSGTLPGTYLTTPSGNYKVYMNSQQNIISGAGQ